MQQHEAFAFLSLLGEIGGFLGLQLGASILTLCEIIDFLIVRCSRSLGRAGQVKTQRESISPELQWSEKTAPKIQASHETWLATDMAPAKQ